MEVIAAQVELLASVWERIAAVGATLTEEEWHLPTGCPGWTVKDAVAHLTGLHREMGGEPPPTVDLPDLDRLRDNPMRGRFEAPVELRRPWSGSAVLAEFTEVTTRRAAELRTLAASGTAADTPVLTPLGTSAPLGRVLPITVFDSWSHEQDVRRATGRPGGLDDPALFAIALRPARSALAARLVDELGAAPGTVVAIDADGISARVVAGDPRADGTGVEPAATLRMSRADLVARVTGRRDDDGGLLGTVEVLGDTGLGGRLAERLGVTP